MADRFTVALTLSSSVTTSHVLVGRKPARLNPCFSYLGLLISNEIIPLRALISIIQSNYHQVLMIHWRAMNIDVVPHCRL